MAVGPTFDKTNTTTAEYSINNNVSTGNPAPIPLVISGHCDPHVLSLTWSWDNHDESPVSEGASGDLDCSDGTFSIQIGDITNFAESTAFSSSELPNGHAKSIFIYANYSYGKSMASVINLVNADTKLVITGPDHWYQYTCIPLTVTQEDFDGKLKTFSSDTNVSIASDSSGNSAFFSDSGCATSTPYVIFSAGSATAQVVYYKETSLDYSVLGTQLSGRTYNEPTKPTKIENYCLQNFVSLPEKYDSLPIKDLSGNSYLALCNPTQIVDLTHQTTVSSLSQTYMLLTDIDMNGQDISPIAGNGTDAFTGTFDGNGYTIANFKITASNSELGIGFFAYTLGSGSTSIKNLTLNNFVVDSNSSDTSYGVGGLVGYADGVSIANCKTMGGENSVVTGNRSVGGLVGSAVNSQILESQSTVTIKKPTPTATTEIKYFGGLVGYLGVNSTITKSTAASTMIIDSGGGQIGGLAGTVTGNGSSITESNAFTSFNLGSSLQYVGGLAGDVYGGSSHSFQKDFSMSSNTIEANANLGGFIGQIVNNASVTISDSFSGSSVTGNSSSTGGFIGAITDTSTVSISTSYSYGKVSCGASTPCTANGFFGTISPTLTGLSLTSVFWDQESSEQPDPPSSTTLSGLSTNNLQNSCIGTCITTWLKAANIDATSTYYSSYYPYLVTNPTWIGWDEQWTPGLAYSKAGRAVISTASSSKTVRTFFPKNSTKPSYFEIEINNPLGAEITVGIGSTTDPSTSSLSSDFSCDSTGICQGTDPSNSSLIALPIPPVTGHHIIGVAVNQAQGIWLSIDGYWLPYHDPSKNGAPLFSLPTSGGSYFYPTVTLTDPSQRATIRLRNQDMRYTVPDYFFAWIDTATSP